MTHCNPCPEAALQNLLRTYYLNMATLVTIQNKQFNVQQDRMILFSSENRVPYPLVSNLILHIQRAKNAKSITPVLMVIYIYMLYKPLQETFQTPSKPYFWI